MASTHWGLILALGLCTGVIWPHEVSIRALCSFQTALQVCVALWGYGFYISSAGWCLDSRFMVLEKGSYSDFEGA